MPLIHLPLNMSPFYLNQPSSISIPERDKDQSHILSAFNIANDAPSVSCPILFHTLHDQGHRDHHLHQQNLQQEEIINGQYLISGVSNCSLPHPTIDGKNTGKRKPSMFTEYPKEEFHVHGGWMSSKMRIMRKMINSSRTVMSNSRRNMQANQDQTQPPSKDFSTSNKDNSPCGIIRVCSDCHTTKTPLWRSGPSGPKSLCNACGIRQRKARRAMAMAAAAAAGGGRVSAHAPAKVRKEKKLDVDHTVPFKKRCKFTHASSTFLKNTASSNTQKKLCSEDVILSTSASFHQVFPQDERDAAILLMALSYGLVRS